MRQLQREVPIRTEVHATHPCRLSVDVCFVAGTLGVIFERTRLESPAETGAACIALLKQVVHVSGDSRMSVDGMISLVQV